MRLASLLACLCGILWPVAGQAPQPERQAAGALRVTSRLVLVDVVVLNKQGGPANDLKKEDFSLAENGKPLNIATFSLTEAGANRPAVQPATLPPNFFTNRPEYRTPPGPLTILLLDALNTPLSD